MSLKSTYNAQIKQSKQSRYVAVAKRLRHWLFSVKVPGLNVYRRLVLQVGFRLFFGGFFVVAILIALLVPMLQFFTITL